MASLIERRKRNGKILLFVNKLIKNVQFYIGNIVKQKDRLEFYHPELGKRVIYPNMPDAEIEKQRKRLDKVMKENSPEPKEVK